MKCTLLCGTNVAKRSNVDPFGIFYSRRYLLLNFVAQSSLRKLERPTVSVNKSIRIISDIDKKNNFYL